MTAEDKANGESANEGVDPRNLSIQGSVDESTVVVGDCNVINQGPSYYTTNVFGALDTGQLQLKYLRKLLLKQMKTDVAQRLEDSLHNLIRVDLAQEEQRYQVGRRRKEPLVELTPISTQSSYELIQRELAVPGSDEVREAIPPAEQTYNIFHRSDIGGRLLILGEPGAGKTTELLMVAQRLVYAAIEDNEQPIPLIFELSNWTPNTSILIWLGQQLQKSYGVSKKLAEPLATQWIRQAQILLLLDGLDELGQQKQTACINALEDFLAQHPALSMLICCRREEYEHGREQLKHLNGAIYLQALGLQQIQKYLTDLGREQLWEGIRATPDLLRLAQSPLFLTMLVIAYQGKSIQDTESLFNAYVHKQLHEPSRQGVYKSGKEKSPRKTLHYLRWLAGQLQKRNATEFLIENLQPDWLGSRKQKKIYRAFYGLNAGLFFGLLSGLSVGLFFGLRYGLFFGLFFGLWGGISESLGDKPNKIRLAEQLHFNFRRGLTGGLLYGLSTGLIFGLLGTLLGGLDVGLSLSLDTWPFFGLAAGLLSGLKTNSIQRKTLPNQGIRKSIHNALFTLLLSGPLFGLLVGLRFGGPLSGLLGGLLAGLGFGMLFGLESTMQHFALRITLTINGYIPWNYAQFLEHAVRHRFIQRTGGRYRFVHDLLRQHFALITPEQQALLAQPTRGNKP